MLLATEELERDEEDELPPELADLAHSLDPDDLENLAAQPCPECGGERLHRIARAVKLPLKGGAWLSLPELTRSTPDALLKHLRHLALDRRGRLIAADIIPMNRHTSLRFRSMMRFPSGETT